MSIIYNFTKAMSFIPAPAEYSEPWLTGDAFKWDLVYNKPALGSIIVEAGFPFDGASIPPIPILRIIFPKVHPSYMQSAALHDWCLKHERHRFSRDEIDVIFKQALMAQKNPQWRVNGMYCGVSAFGRLMEGKGYDRLGSQSL